MTRPYFSDGLVTLHHGDCRAVWPALAIEPDCIIADPPYGETSLPWDRWPEGWPGIAADYASSMWCFGSMRMFWERSAEFNAWNLSQDIVWRKQNGTGFATDRFRRVHEHALHFYRGGWNLIYHETPRVHVGVREPDRSIKQGAGHARHLGKIGDRGAWIDDGTRLHPSVVDAPNMWRRGAIHPTEKSPEILQPLIEYACPPGGLILDPFAGSGSTAAYARSTGRRAVLIEADERYCEAIANRFSQGVLDFEEPA